MLDRLRLVAIFHFLGGALTFCVGVYFAVILSGVRIEGDGDPRTNLLSAIVIIGLEATMLLIGAIPIISGVLIWMRAWRWLSILISLLFLPFFPIGTGIAIFSLWVLTSDETQVLYAT